METRHLMVGHTPPLKAQLFDVSFNTAWTTAAYEEEQSSALACLSTFFNFAV